MPYCCTSKLDTVAVDQLICIVLWYNLDLAHGACSLKMSAATNFDLSVTRRLLLAREQLPTDTPNYWEIVSSFGFKGSSKAPSSNEVRVAVENLEYIDKQAVISDEKLLLELRSEKIFQGHCLGIVLISSNSNCLLCGEQLLVRSDQPSFLTIYTSSGTVPATHFRKYCRRNRKGCPFTQHYGFHSVGIASEVAYDSNWDDLTYFLATHKTGFELALLKQFNVELLLGQISYKQKSEIYNSIHGYERAKKHCGKRLQECQGINREEESDSEDEAE